MSNLNSKFSLLRKPFKYSYFGVAFFLLGCNLLFFLLTSVKPQLQYQLGLIPSSVVYLHSFWQFVTYMFIHGSFQHLLFNMLTLLLVGVALEKAIGSKEFLLFYLVDGILSGVISFLIYLATGQMYVVLIGASGALYGVLFLFSVVYPNTRFFVFGLIPVPAPLLILIYAGIEIFSEFSGRSGSVAHLTHLAGFLVAWLYCRIRFNISPIRVWKNR